MNLDEFVFVHGGELCEQSLPAPITQAQYQLFSGWLRSLQEQWLDPFTEGAGCPNVVLIQNLSPSLVCRAREFSDNSAGVLIPIGVLVRTTVLARLLLKPLDQGDTLPWHFIASVQDDTVKSDWEIAPRLVAIFGEYSNKADHWLALTTLPEYQPSSSHLEQRVNDLVLPCIVYLIWHEVAHIARQHCMLRKQAQHTRDGLYGAQISDTAVMRALELDADLMAAQLLLSTMITCTETTSYESAFYWLGYAITMIFGLYDCRRKALNLYSDAYYPHPLVRRQLFSDFAATYIANNLPNLAATWRAQERAGWSACIKALRHLDFEVFSGSFGGAKDPRARLTPVTALTYTYFDSMFMRDWADKEIAHAEEMFGRLHP